MIDAHQHFWQRSLPFDYRWLDAERHAPIRRDFLPEHLAPLLAETPVRRCVFVQTQHDTRENDWALSLCDKHPFVVGVVGWVDLASEACEEQVLRYREDPRFVGVRHITQDEPDDDFIIRPDVLRGLRILEKHRVPFDLLFYVKHLRHAATLAKLLPGLPMVIDHLAKPRVREGILEDWEPHLRAAAKFPNVYCKLSGLVTEADWKAWKPADLLPYVAIALEAFGPSRCMFGSDWPVCELAATYGQVFASMREAVGGLSAAEEKQVFGETAAAFYGLPTG
jgi:L-fuconolactonase